MMNIYEMRMILGDSQIDFSDRYHIPIQTVQEWESGISRPPEYVTELLEERVTRDRINRKTFRIPCYEPGRISLPDSADYLYNIDWLKAVQVQVGERIVFALDEALMCLGMFGGWIGEYIIWAYGSEHLSRYDGIFLLGNEIDDRYIQSRKGIYYTNFNRTLIDSLANESILDMQGITEALSDYYFTHDESFNGLYVPPEYMSMFDSLADDAIHYYDE